MAACARPLAPNRQHVHAQLGNRSKHAKHRQDVSSVVCLHPVYRLNSIGCVCCVVDVVNGVMYVCCRCCCCCRLLSLSVVIVVVVVAAAAAATAAAAAADADVVVVVVVVVLL